MQELFELIADRMKKEGVDTQIDNSDGDIILRIIPDSIGPDEDGVVITEICKVPFENDEYGYFQIYTTIAKDVEKEVYPRALVKLNEMNLSSLIGFYGILSDYGMVYHKYIAKIREAAPAQMANELFDLICDVFGGIDNDYVEVFGAIK